MNNTVSFLTGLFLNAGIASLMLLLLSGCSPGYYWQAASGQMSIVSGREDIGELLEDPALPAEFRQRLELSQTVLTFAHTELQLPDNGSYRSFYDTGSDYVVWNVFAAPEFSLEPLDWCFPVADCVTYRGYFAEHKAQKFAAKLGKKGNDVFVSGVAAYSTLGKFKDPVLNTMLNMSATEFTGLIFHELAHQRLYIGDDTAFNEGFAEAVELIGLQRWSDVTGTDISEEYSGQVKQVDVLLAETRRRLEDLYTEARDEEAMRTAKASILAATIESYQELVAQWQVQGLRYRPYEQMVLNGLNNASLSALATYDDYRPAFMQLYRECEADLNCFYARTEDIAELKPGERERQLNELLAVNADK